MTGIELFVIAAVATAATVGTQMAAAGSAAKSAKKQRRLFSQKAAAEKEARAVEQRRANVMAQKDKFRQMREGRIRRASILQKSQNAGVAGAGTSGVQGAVGSVGSQVGENIGTLGQFQGFAERLSQLSQQSADFSTAAFREQSKNETRQAWFGVAASGFGSIASFASGGMKGAGKAAGGLSGASSVASSGASSMAIPGGASDRRLKRNIVRIGTHPIGVPLYKWTYVWGEDSIGVMADELREVMPKAVFKYLGYDCVRYDMIGGRTGESLAGV